MALTLAAFRARWRAYANVTTYPDTYLDPVLQEALRMVNAAYFRNRADEAQGHYASHLLELDRPQRLAGVSSVTAGPASVSYFAPANAGAPATLMATAGGQMYLQILKSVGPASQVL